LGLIYYSNYATESSFKLSPKKATSQPQSYGLLQELANAAGVAFLVGAQMPSSDLNNPQESISASLKPFIGGY